MKQLLELRDAQGKGYTWECVGTKKDAITQAEKDGYTVVKVANASTHHFCGYCGAIASGSDENVLCGECRSLFGHAFFSEL